MKTYSKIKLINLRRPVLTVVAAVTGLSGMLPAVMSNTAFAAQVQSRSITMSDSRVSQTGVSYTVQFTPATAAKSMVIDFCQETPIIGATCTSPSGMSVASAALTAGTGTSGWTLGTHTGTTVKLTGATATPTLSPINFTLTNVTNPSGLGSFYARVYTYVDTAYGAGSPYVSPVNVGSSADYGGFALSTANTINISATVMETLTFCVSLAAPGASCTGLSAPSVIIGHGTPVALDSTQTDSTPAYTQISTNAQHGAVVNMKNTSSTTCAGLSSDNGATCPITAKTSAGAFGASTAGFGLQVGAGTPLSGGTGSTVAVGSYGTAYYVSNATFGASGDSIMNTNGTVCSNVNTPITFGAQAGPTTPAGVYSATEDLIATGTF